MRLSNCGENVAAVFLERGFEREIDAGGFQIPNSTKRSQTNPRCANLARFEGEVFGQDLIVRGSLERLTPVLMAALVAAFALAPLLFVAEAPGTEILHPVAVVIFSGLISSTLLDAFVTPALFFSFGERPPKRLLEAPSGEAF